MNLADFYTLVLDAAPITALVGSRMYPMVIPCEVFDRASKKPCLVYTVTSPPTDRTTCGATAVQETTVALDCYARAFDVCVALADEVRSHIQDYSGTVGATYFEDVTVTAATDIYDPDPGLFRRVLTLKIWSYDNG